MQKKMKDFKKENAGRSMTEMLGVLAIIGVLSLGGIIGYKLAMNRYAANQIAYEINMMKTDAKVKIMQGNDTLTLGEPYDSHKIRFGDYGTTFGCSFIKDADDESVVVEEAATCQVANAYYIELQHIPEGICKPLANLINNMNDLIAFDINLTESEEGRVGGDCQGDNNTLNAVFSAEPGDLEVLKCEKKEDCPDGLKCLNHLCVECTDDTDCGKTGYCENNACEYCESGVWDSATKQCVDCLEKTDCVNNPNGKVCDTTEKKCVECLNYTDCTDREKPVCNDDNMCEECPPKSVFYEGKCYEYVCRQNKDCNADEYCAGLLPTSGFSGTVEWNDDPSSEDFTGKCEEYAPNVLSGTVEGRTWYGSANTLNWWSGCRFCAALAGADDSECAQNQSSHMVGSHDLNWHCVKDEYAAEPPEKAGWCTKNGGENPSAAQSSDNISSTMQELKAMYKNKWTDLWLSDFTMDVTVQSGHFGFASGNKNSANRALCKSYNH